MGELARAKGRSLRGLQGRMRIQEAMLRVVLVLETGASLLKVI